MTIPRFRRLVFFLLTLFVLTPISLVQAHGEPVIAIQPAIAPAGGQITITGTEMESGEVFEITLENSTEVIPLGEVIVTGEE